MFLIFQWEVRLGQNKIVAIKRGAVIQAKKFAPTKIGQETQTLETEIIEPHSTVIETHKAEGALNIETETNSRQEILGTVIETHRDAENPDIVTAIVAEEIIGLFLRIVGEDWEGIAIDKLLDVFDIGNLLSLGIDIAGKGVTADGAIAM